MQDIQQRHPKSDAFTIYKKNYCFNKQIKEIVKSK
jgi:hypothetical protein